MQRTWEKLFFFFFLLFCCRQYHCEEVRSSPHILDMNFTRSHVLERFWRARVSRHCRHQELKDFWEHKRSKTPKRGVVVWECRVNEMCGGNGDRLRGIAGALYNAVRIGYDLSIVWDNPVDMSAILPHNLPPLKNLTKEQFSVFSNTLSVASFDHTTSALRECDWINYDNVIVRSNELYSSSCGDEDGLGPFFFENTLNVSDHHWNRYPCLGCVFWFLFSISLPLQNSVENELKHLSDWSKQNNRSHSEIVAIHFRGGDHYMNVTSAYRGDKRLELSALHKMISCADRLARNFSEPPTILLCADSEAAKAYAVKYYGARLYASKITSFHSDREGKDVGNGTLGTWVDVMLLGLADGIVLSSSGFGVLAAQIGMYSHSQIMTHDDCFSPTPLRLSSIPPLHDSF